MSRDAFKEQFAQATAAAFRDVYPEVFKSNPDLPIWDSSFIYDNLEKPKDPSMGRFAFPTFRWAKCLKDGPPGIATAVASATFSHLPIGPDRLVMSIATGGFLNCKVNSVALATQMLKEIFSKGSEYGSSDEGKGRKYLVEYSSPNIAKPFGVGHLRSTVIGNSLRRIYRKLGYDAIGINFLGDWGTQFGKMIVAYKKWGDAATLESDAIKNLLNLYVKYHVEVENDAILDEEARAEFKRLEEGDPQAVELWEKFKNISQAEFDRVYNLLGIEFDLVTGESFLNDKMEATIVRLGKAGLTTTSRGALVVEMDDPNLPPCLLRKGDGATLYATRDLAGLEYRWNEYRFHRSLYVVGSAQSDHFKQAFSVVAKLEEAEGLSAEDRMTGRVKHIEFGWVKFGEQTMSTRRGNIVFLEDVIDKAVSLVKEKIKQKNPKLPGMDATALMVGTGAVIFSQLSVRRRKDVNFSWDDVLSFEGETGPYLQYTHARLCSLERKYEQEITDNIHYELLAGDEEIRVIELLADFPEAVSSSAVNYDPFFIATYLIRLASAFNKFYQRKNADGQVEKIISGDKELSAARIAIVKATRLILAEGLHLIGLKAPEEM